MKSNIFKILLFILYFCCASIFCESSSPDSKNSSGNSQLYCLGGENEKGKGIFQVSKLNSTNNQWESVTEMKTTRIQFGASVIRKKIYVCGGYNKQTMLHLLEVYDCEKNTWAELTPTQNVRSDFGMTTLDDHIYVAGGWDVSVNKLSSVLKYSPETNTWAEVKPMNQARHNHDLVTLNGSIYAIGGWDTRTVERYNPSIDEWDFVASTKHSHSSSGITSHQNKIYVLSEGGFEVYHPESNVWEDLPSLDVANGLQLVSINDKLLALGAGVGDHKGKASKAVYQFDTTKNSWIHLPDMNVARKFYRAVVVN